MRHFSVNKNNINRLFLAIFLVIFSAFCVNSAFAEHVKKYVEGDVVVIFKGETGTNVMASALKGMGREALRTASIASEHGAWVKDTYANLSESGNHVFTLLHSDILSTDELVKAVKARSDVVAASPNYIFHTADVPNDTATPANNTGLWGLNAIGVTEVWSKDITGSQNVYVAIIDTGVDYTHSDLAANVDKNLSKNFVSGVSDYMDDNGHGTHVAGVIGAVGNNGYGIVGVNWNVKLIALKALNKNGSGSLSNVIAALDYLRGLLNSNTNMSLSAINMSIETYVSNAPSEISNENEPLWYAMKLLDVTNRTTMVVAAGNSGITVGEPAPAGSSGCSEGDYVYPASFNGIYNMLSVSAIDSDGNLGSFSNKNASIAAPGVKILSTYPASITSKGSTLSDGAKVNTMTGTSMATPHISGAVALLKSYDNNFTASQIRTILLNSGKETLASANSANSVKISSNINSLLNIADVINYVENDTNEAVILAAEELPEEYNTVGTPSSSSSSSGSNNNDNNNNSGGGGGGGSGCAGADYGVLALLLVLIVLKINKKVCNF